MARLLGATGIALLKGVETLRLRAYDDLRPNHVLVEGDEVLGKLTNGYGHTGPDVFIGQEIDEEQADNWLLADSSADVKAVDANTPDDLTQNAFDALCVFAYNVGAHAFIGSTMDKLLQAGEPMKAAQEFIKWNKSGGKVLGGLTRRRKMEKILFLTPDDVTPDYSKVTEDPNAWP